MQARSLGWKCEFPPRGGNGKPLQYSCLQNPMDRGAWRSTVHRVAESQTRLSDPAHRSLWGMGVGPDPGRPVKGETLDTNTIFVWHCEARNSHENWSSAA